MLARSLDCLLSSDELVFLWDIFSSCIYDLDVWQFQTRALYPRNRTIFNVERIRMKEISSLYVNFCL